MNQVGIEGAIYEIIDYMLHFLLLQLSQNDSVTACKLRAHLVTEGNSHNIATFI